MIEARRSVPVRSITRTAVVPVKSAPKKLAYDSGASGRAVKVAAENTTGPLASPILSTNASSRPPPKRLCSADAVTGKFCDSVKPVS